MGEGVAMKALVKLVGCIFILFFLGMCSLLSGKPHEPETRSSNLSSATPSVSNPDYEHDIEERCKDWIFYRNRAYKLGREGDRQGASDASRAMNRYYDDLRKIFTEQQVTETISKIEAGGYKGGF